MNRAEILTTSSGVIEDVTGYPHAQIEEKQILSDDLGVDSLTLWEIVLGLEERFRISIPDKDVNAWSSVADVVSYIETLFKQ